MEVLRPHVKINAENGKAGKIIVGVVEGDIHDIGKNLLKTMFEAPRWKIYDMRKDVKFGRFVEEQQKTNADLVARSALMTTNMLAMPKVIEMLKAESLYVIIIIGGEPLTPQIAQQYGADG
jgi:methanogenic corrinoid protein MtbC1